MTLHQWLSWPLALSWILLYISEHGQEECTPQAHSLHSGLFAVVGCLRPLQPTALDSGLSPDRYFLWVQIATLSLPFKPKVTAPVLPTNSLSISHDFCCFTTSVDACFLFTAFSLFVFQLLPFLLSASFSVYFLKEDKNCQSVSTTEQPPIPYQPSVADMGDRRQSLPQSPEDGQVESHDRVKHFIRNLSQVA